MRNFEVKNNVAVYHGVMDAFFILETAREAQRLAATENIVGFEITLPNTEFLDGGIYAELKSKGFKILRVGDGTTVVGQAFTRTVTTTVVVEHNQMTVPEPIDLSRVV